MANDPLLDGVLPSMGSGQHFFEKGDPRVLGWLREAITEGERINKSDPAYERMDQAATYVMGEQMDSDRPSYLPKVVVNQTKKSIRAHVSALTDLKPLFSFHCGNPAYEQQSYLLNKLVVMWWTNTFADLDLADVIRYSLTMGAGDCVVEYDNHYGNYGDNRLIPRDARDTLPIRPSRERSIQTWEGVVIREAHSPNVLRGMFPDKAHLLKPDSEGQRFGASATKFRRLVKQVVTPTIFDRLQSGPTQTGSGVSPELTLYRVFLTDRSVNATLGPVLMGKPGTSWAYMVQPGERLYPRKRLIVATETVILYDGPSPYWHGMFPISRLRLDPWPWLFFGLGLTHDLKPMQDGLNTIVNDFISTFSQWVNRGVIADKNAVPESLLRRFDPRRKNWKMKLNPTYGEGFKLADGPTLPPWSMEFLQMLFTKFDEHSGTANLQALMQLRQMPGADTIQKYYEAMTPELRLEGRLIEAFLRDVADMIKVNIFQYYSTSRRMMMLGEQGLALEDLDYDPGTLVPAMTPDMEGYTPELDKKHSRDVRAQYFQRLFTFSVEPNSILAMNAVEKKMEGFQMFRMGVMDFWTFHERMQTPNVGSPPAVPLPPKDPQNPDPNTAVMDPMTGMPTGMEMRVPETITERLMAQMSMGLGQGESGGGRKPSGQEPPDLEQKSDGRTTITES